MSPTVEQHLINDRLRTAVGMAHIALMDDLSCPRPRIHIGQAVADWMKSLCLTEDLRLPPGSKYAGFDVVVEPEWEPDRVVLRVDREIR